MEQLKTKLNDECLDYLLSKAAAVGADTNIDNCINPKLALAARIELLEMERTRALTESVKLQSHYAELLNMFDGGSRMSFASSEEWIQRLREKGEE